MITLFQFHRVWGLPNASPFCMKLETWLRMAKIPYTVEFVNNPKQGPKGKLPYIQIDGQLYADSELIIDELKERFGDPLDAHLTPEQKALSVLIDHAFCERMYWIGVYMRWQDDAGWTHLKHTMFGKLPVLAKLFVPNLVRKQMLKQLYAQGYGRHNKDEIARLGRKTIDALTYILGEQPYFLGDKPTSVDATAFGFLANMIWSPLDDPLTQHVLQIDTIRSYCDRMRDAWYPDFVKPDH